ncbi:MAG: terminase small subunit [Steroidobacteraceae bacterium]
MTALVKRKPTAAAVPVLTAKQESFAAHYCTYGNAEAAYRHAYDSTTTRRASVQHAAWQTLHHPAVAGRITTLRNVQAAGDDAVSRERLIADLEALVSVSVEELMRLSVRECPACWLDDAWDLAAAAALDRGEEPPASDEPNEFCKICAGAGRTVVHLTPTHLLSAPARRLFKGLELYGDQTVKRVLLHDQAQLRIELHKLKGMHVDRSVSLNAHVNVPALPKNISVADALDLLNKLSPVPLDADDTPLDNVVSEQ